MNFQSVDEALRVLEDMTLGANAHLEAVRYLSSLDECYEAEGLVHALQNDDFGVRWEAGNLLAKMGKPAIPAMMQALLDPKRVADSRLREGMVHILHKLEDHVLKNDAAPLLSALKGPAPEMDTMKQAYLLFRKIDPQACPEIKEFE